MKKCSLACFAFVAVLLLSACGGSKEDGPVIPGPSMTLDGSSNIEKQEFINTKVVPLVFDVPGKIATFSVTVNAPDPMYYGVLNNVISIDKNKYPASESGPVLDLINDSRLLSVYQSAFIPEWTSSLLGKKTVTLDACWMLAAFINAGAPSTGDEFTFTFNVSDENGKSLKKPVTFFFISPPSFELKPTKTMYDLDTNEDCNVKISFEVPGKLQGATLTVRSDNESFIRDVDDMIGIEANKKDHILDLVNDAKAVAGLKAYGIPTGNEIVGKEKVMDLSLIQLLPKLKMSASGTRHSFIFSVTDESGRTSQELVLFSKK